MGLFCRQPRLLGQPNNLGWFDAIYSFLHPFRLPFAFSPNSTRRRTASGREGNGCFCLAIHSSNPASIGGCVGMATGSPVPVAGGPLFFRGITVFFFMIP